KLIEDQPVQRARRVETGPKRLFDNCTNPGPLFVRVRAPGKSARAEVLQRHLEYARRNRQVEQSVSIVLLRARLDFVETLLDVGVGGVSGEITAGVKSPLA